MIASQFATLIRSACMFMPMLAACAASAESPRTLRFETLSVEHGLAQETASAILQDRDGFLWIGSQAGLARYDGQRTQIFRAEPDDSGSLADNWISAIHEDRHGRLWVGSRGGLQWFDPVAQKFVTAPGFSVAKRSAASRNIQAIVADPIDGLWVGHGDGLQRLDAHGVELGSWQQGAEDSQGLPHSSVTSLAWDLNARLWVGTAAGLARLDDRGARVQHLARSVNAEGASAESIVLALRVARDGKLWVGGEQGLQRWDLATPLPQGRRFGAGEGFPVSAVQALLEDHLGQIWVGTQTAGLLRWDAERDRFVGFRHHIGDRKSLADDNVNALFQDRSGTLWVGTRTGGASHADLASGGFERHARFDQVAGSREGNKIYAVLIDGADTVWLGSVGAGLHRIDRRTGEVRNFRHDPADPLSLPHDDVGALHRDAKGRLWVGTNAGLAEFDRERGTLRRVMESAPNHPFARITRVVSDGEGVLWVGCDAGLIRFEPATGAVRMFRHDPQDNQSIGYGRILALLSDRRGRIWVGTDGGLDYLPASGSGFTHILPEPERTDGLFSGRISSIAEDRQGRLWIGTAGGLHRLDEPDAPRPSFLRYGRAQGMAADPIGATLEDALGQLWISTTAGLSRLDPESGAVRNYTARDGLIDSSFYVGAAAQASDGTMFFGGPGGLVEFQPSGLRDNAIAPQIAITELQLFNRPLTAASLPEGVSLSLPVHRARTLSVPHNQSMLSVEFAALHFANSERNRFAYRMLGLDDAWVESDVTRRYVTYSGLAPGQYTFEVRAANKDGVWSAEPARLQVTVVPPWWATPWARASAMLLAAFALWGVYRVRVRGLTQQRAVLEREVAARTAEVVQQKEAIEQAHQNLSVLGDIGREITATLDVGEIVATLDRHVHVLLDATTFVIYRLDQEAGCLRSLLRTEHGSSLAEDTIPLQGSPRYAARCARERSELYLDFEPGQDDPSQVPGTIESLSCLFAPMLIGERLLGVMTIQSPKRHAYGERERQVFRTLCAYAAIALDNAASYQRLAEIDADVQRMLDEQKLIFDHVAAAVFFVRDRVILRCNRGMESMLGYAPGELIGQPTRIYHPSAESWEALNRQVYSRIHAGEVADGEWEIVRKDGQPIWIGFRGRAVNPKDEAQGTIWVAQDITERKRAEAELEQIRREQQIIYDNAVGAISVMRHGRIERCSRGFVALFGYSEEDLQTLPVEQLAADLEYSRQQFRAHIPELASGLVVRGEFEYRRKDGATGWLVYQGRALEPPGLDQGVIWLSQDITALKHQEHILRESKEQVERSLAEVEQLNRQVSMLGELTGFLQACSTAEEAYSCIGEFGPRLFEGSRGVLYLRDDEADAWLRHGNWGLREGDAADRFADGDCWALRRSRIFRVDTSSVALCCPHVRGHAGEHHAYACLPLNAQGKTFGLLHIVHAEAIEGDLAERRHGIAVAMAEQIALAIANVQLREALLQQSIRDALTGLYNRRFLQEALFREIGRSKREQLPLALLMIDVDHFKRCNDRFGHPAGDHVLKQVARVLEQGLRAGHLACRFGGEEFAVLLPGCELESATRVAERLLEGMRALVLSHDGRALDRVTVSLGIGLFPHHGGTPESLIEAADGALYAAKQGGRDRLAISANG